MTERPPSWRRLIDGWMQIVAHFGEVQTLVLLGLIYVLVVGPASLISRAFGSDFLSKRSLRGIDSAWRDAESSPPDLERAKLQT